MIGVSVSASSQSLRFILSLRMNSSFITSRAGVTDFPVLMNECIDFLLSEHTALVWVFAGHSCNCLCFLNEIYANTLIKIHVVLRITKGPPTASSSCRHCLVEVTSCHTGGSGILNTSWK